MRTVFLAVALAASAAASPFPNDPAADLSNSESSSHPVAQITKAPPPAMVQETVPENHWVTVARARKQREDYDNFLMNQPRVNVSLYAMSRCPDARMCENVFEEVLKREGIHDKVDLSINYIGKVNKDATYGVECMHGDLECAGNAHQLCLQANLDLKAWYSVIACMNYGKFPGSVGTLATTRKCVETNGVDYWRSGVGPCIEGQKRDRQSRHAQKVSQALGWGGEVKPQMPLLDEDGEPLDEEPEPLSKEARQRLRESVQKTKKDGVEKSCTIRIDSTVKRGGLRECIVDGGVWRGCDDGHSPSDFVRVIEEEYEHLVDEMIDTKERWIMWP